MFQNLTIVKRIFIFKSNCNMEYTKFLYTAFGSLIREKIKPEIPEGSWLQFDLYPYVAQTGNHRRFNSLH